VKNNKDIQIVRIKLPRSKSESYEITIGQGVLNTLGQRARQVSHAQSRRICLVSNQKVFDLYGSIAIQSLREASYEVSTFLMGEGERFKSFRTLERTIQFFSETKLERNDAVVALGGGVVGDLAGFAAAVYLRGVAFIQVPTTLLAQIDSSVGGKTAVNTGFGKNLVGAFHQPSAVLIDTDTLDTLPRRELTAGWCEAIKQGAIGSKKLFDQTVGYLSSNKTESLSSLIAAQCAFKASIVAGDEREDIRRMDSRSRRILNFGHTVAHALETATNYKRFRHGEAVGYGMLAACEIGKGLDITPPDALDSILAAIKLAGRLPQTRDLAPTEIIRLIEHDKKSVGGKIKWVFLEKLGKARIVDGSDVPSNIVQNSLRIVLGQYYL
jgi:3-dehydroquinate synthase